MPAEPTDRLAALLAEGWQIAGYNSNVLAAGAIVQSLLLRKDEGLIAVSILLMGENETGRTFVTLSPAPLGKKGWF